MKAENDDSLRYDDSSQNTAIELHPLRLGHENPTLTKPKYKSHSNKAHAWFSKRKRAIILLLLMIISALGCIFVLVPRRQARYYSEKHIAGNPLCLSPRTICDCHDPPESPQSYKDGHWLTAVQSNKERAERAVEKIARGSDSALDVVFYGDSITEGWSGTRYGKPSARFASVPPVFNEFFGDEGLALGVSGDTTANLLWRLRNGEMPSDLRAKVWWILVGVNNFLRTQCSPEAVLRGIKAVATEVLERSHKDEHVVLNSLLPTNGVSKNIIGQVNSGLDQLCDEMKNMGYRVEFFNATDIFVGHDSEGRSIVNTSLMPDALHPNALGHRLWAEKIVERLNHIRGSEPTQL